MLTTAGEARTKLINDVLQHMDTSVLAELKKFTYISSLQTLNSVKAMDDRDEWRKGKSRESVLYDEIYTMVDQ